MKYLIDRLKVSSLAALLAMLGMVTPSLPGKLLAADRPLQKINVAYSSISGNIAALWVTQDKGFFRKYGMEIQAVLIESGTTTAQALVAGDIAFANVAGPAVIQSNDEVGELGRSLERMRASLRAAMIRLNRE